ncbi:pilus assembly protein [Quadrisphaera sp. DSM 44207]|uniref:pilus assembly protein n=1 Tax=Quadrisphaera sp. DSM 44207 TaxID=1881057 RepID=UPI0008872542|nr:pilus assembly protein [Quadrisphaera sp. DSM 44207]SDQ08436.1 hypothetical protein SAMN05428996_0437 [Quadrisphaera sp. DSM 44207]
MTRARSRAVAALVRLRGDDTGGAVVEFVGLAVVLLLPLVYLVVVLGEVQAGAYAVEAAARSAARAYTGAASPEQSAGAARAAVSLALSDHGFAVDPDAVTQVSCEASPCLSPEARVSVRVHLDVDLPGVPALLAGVAPVQVPVEAESVAVVDRFVPGAS